MGGCTVSLHFKDSLQACWSASRLVRLGRNSRLRACRVLQFLHMGEFAVDDETKREIKRIARNTQIRVAESLLRWKYKKEGKEVPEDGELHFQSRIVAERAQKIITRRSKNVWAELKKTYRKNRAQEDDKE